jgi:hypothetical protein
MQSCPLDFGSACQVVLSAAQAACKTAKLENAECIQSIGFWLAATTNAKLDLLATGGLIALALALNLAYINLAALRFPEKLKKFVTNKLKEDRASKQLEGLFKTSAAASVDRALASLIYRFADDSLEIKNRPDLEGMLVPIESKHISGSSSARLFYKFVFEGKAEFSPVPTLDKVLCAICGIVAVALLFRDTAEMMNIQILNLVWAFLIGAPLTLLLVPMLKKKSSRYTGLLIGFIFLIFVLHLFYLSQLDFYIKFKNQIDFGILTACVLVPTLLVAWSNSAYPAIEDTIAERLDQIDAIQATNTSPPVASPSTATNPNSNEKDSS